MRMMLICLVQIAILLVLTSLHTAEIILYQEKINLDAFGMLLLVL